MSDLPVTHLLRLSDSVGIFEHALFDEPRREHGYCVDDVARALLVAVREPEPGELLTALAESSLSFIESAIVADGRCHNRLSIRRRWSDLPDVGDWWGRAIWALGVTAARAQSGALRERALGAAIVAMQQRSPFVRARAFAAIGAAEILLAYPFFGAVRIFLEEAIAGIPLVRTAEWDWPEERLRYANGALVEALLGAGMALERPEMASRGLELLGFLVHHETRDGHLSVTSSGGSGPETIGPQFDQQPIEVAAIADAASRAFEYTGHPVWRSTIDRSWAWFVGDNDTGVPMFDPVTGAGFDGLEEFGRNENRGAESTLAALSTYQTVRRLSTAIRA